MVSVAVKKDCCSRCRRTDDLHVHHDRQHVDGGSDSANNLIVLCSSCHKLEHALRSLQSLLNDAHERSQGDRIIYFENRIDLLQSLNTPEVILGRGSYMGLPTGKFPPVVRSPEEEIEHTVQRINNGLASHKRICECLRCGYLWVPVLAYNGKPKKCPKCRSSLWNIPYRRAKNGSRRSV